MTSKPGFYIAIIAVALVITFVLALQVAGAFFKLLFICAVFVLAFAAVRAWMAQAR